MMVSISTLKSPLKLLYITIQKARYGEFGKGSRINPINKIKGKKSIYVGRDVLIKFGCWIETNAHTGYKPSIKIGKGSHIGHYCHIYSTKLITIENDVLIADKVFISDNTHEYINCEIPIIKQGVRQLNSVVIGEGSWIGENVCINGASIGKNCIIGSNSVVTKDIPDYCIAVGAPAKVIKKYNFKNNKWEKT